MYLFIYGTHCLRTLTSERLTSAAELERNLLGISTTLETNDGFGVQDLCPPRCGSMGGESRFELAVAATLLEKNKGKQKQRRR